MQTIHINKKQERNKNEEYNFFFDKAFRYLLKTFLFLYILRKKIKMLLNYKKHTRTPSQIEISEFKALTKLDASQTLQKELQKLLLTAPNSETDVKS
jgi:hypothetical protein